MRREGPFGDHTGYYSLADDYPVFHITAITHRKDPIYAATVVGRPPMEDCFLAKATERIFLPLLKQMLPEVVDVNMPLEGVFHDCVVVSIKKQFPMHARKVMHALWGMGQMMNVKMIIVVDAHVNVQNMKEVWWRVSTTSMRNMTSRSCRDRSTCSTTPRPWQSGGRSSASTRRRRGRRKAMRVSGRMRSRCRRRSRSA